LILPDHHGLVDKVGNILIRPNAGEGASQGSAR
jgi:hypothetical protein